MSIAETVVAIAAYYLFGWLISYWVCEDILGLSHRGWWSRLLRVAAFVFWPLALGMVVLAVAVAAVGYACFSIGRWLWKGE